MGFDGLMGLGFFCHPYWQPLQNTLILEKFDYFHITNFYPLFKSLKKMRVIRGFDSQICDF